MEVVAAEAASQEARRLVLARDAAEGGAAALLEQLQAAHGEAGRLEARVAELEGAALVAAEEVPHAHQIRRAAVVRVDREPEEGKDVS